MRYFLLLPLLILLLGAVPLTDSQQTRLETADDGSMTVDEAAFYALLENASEWTTGEAGATIPDYSQVRENPEPWRGKLCLIEGVLLSQLPELDLSREGHENTRGLVIQIDSFNKSRRDLAPSDMLIAYLTHPPQLSAPRIQLDPNMLAETGSKIRFVARFYKILTEKNTRGEDRQYLTFVGKDAELEVRDTGPGTFTVPLILAALIIGGGLLFIRLFRKGKGRFSSNRTAEYIARKRAERVATESGEYEEEDDGEPLPDDPTDALGELSRRHSEHDNENKFE